ncbi:MAG: Spy/CpxP family protein refolding chaperone, partial [Cocleimonas sp.]|nr:Spy/CpxP family protein refolding chaperone [Cocleimonas sp.]
KRMPKPSTDKEKAKIARIKHTNPLPNLMQVVVKMGDQLNLTEKQSAELKKWREANKPIFKKVSKTVVTLEAELLEAALNNEPVSKIDQLADRLMQNRVKIIRGKALCRDNMKRILDDEQYKKVLMLHKLMHH